MSSRATLLARLQGAQRRIRNLECDQAKRADALEQRFWEQRLEANRLRAAIKDAVKAWDECEDEHPESCLCGPYKMAAELGRALEPHDPPAGAAP